MPIINYKIFDYGIFKFTGGTKKSHFYIPDNSKQAIWSDIYKNLNVLSHNPIRSQSYKIVKDFGHFGPRIHPVNKKPHFHLGTDILSKIGTPIFPILPGILYYSGFHTRNGNYIMIEHPQITTKDNAKLFSLYMHLDSFGIKIHKWEKVLKILSTKFRQQLVDTQTIIGYLGKTGNAEKLIPHLHLQIEFHKADKQILVLSPEQILNLQ